MTKTKLLALLVAARAKIATPAQWIKGTYAKDKDGFISTSYSEHAVCYCSVGAVKAAVGNDDDGWGQFDLTSALRQALATFGFTAGIVAYNDHPDRTHAEVLAVWDKAIEIVGAELVVENLRAAKAKIEAPEAWMQGYYARTADGNQVLGTNPAAVCFCAFGAIEAVTAKEHGMTGDIPEITVLNAASRAVSDGMYPIASNYNDVTLRTHAEVLALFDKAIELARLALFELLAPKKVSA